MVKCSLLRVENMCLCRRLYFYKIRENTLQLLILFVGLLDTIFITTQVSSLLLCLKTQ